MATRKTMTRTVRFFEILEHSTGAPLSHDLPWEQALTALQTGVTAAERTKRVEGNDHHGGPWLLDGLPGMLIFSKIRDDYELPEIIDRRNGDLDVIQIAEGQGVAETTHVAFFPRNIVAMMRNQSTPGAASLQKWIKEMELFGSGFPALDVAPLSRVDIKKKIEDVEFARGVKVRMRTTASQRIASGAPLLASTMKTLQENFGPVMVEMRIYLPQDDGYTDEAETIKQEAEGLLALSDDGGALDGVQAATMFYRSLETEKAAEVNMFKDKLAERVEVQIIDDDGRVMRRESAAQAMQRAYNALKGDLIRAVDRDRS